MNENLIELLLHVLKAQKNEGNCVEKETVANAKKYIGEYVIVRTRNEGLNCGYLEEADDTGCILKDARRIFRAISKDKSISWYEGIALSGLHKDGMLSAAVTKKIIIEDYSITLTSEIAKNNLIGYISNETTC